MDVSKGGHLVWLPKERNAAEVAEVRKRLVAVASPAKQLFGRHAWRDPFLWGLAPRWGGCKVRLFVCFGSLYTETSAEQTDGCAFEMEADALLTEEKNPEEVRAIFFKLWYFPLHPEKKNTSSRKGSSRLWGWGRSYVERKPCTTGGSHVGVGR